MPDRHRVRRGGALALVACLVALATPAVAPAHGGSPLQTEHVGGYLYELYVLPTHARDGSPAVDFTAYLHDLSTSHPDDRAQVSMHVRTPKGTFGPYRAVRTANSYEVVLSEEHTGDWRDWDVMSRITGPAGAARTDYRTLYEAAPGWVTPAGVGVIVLTLLAFALGVLRRRRAAARTDAHATRARVESARR